MNKTATEIAITQIREVAAVYLWKLGAVQINVSEPFTLVSGKKSPIYINCRKVLKSTQFVDLFVTGFKMITSMADIQVVAGGETAGIPFAAFVARACNLPMSYVRKKKKGYGLASLVEGCIPRDLMVILVEDLITDAGSKLHFISALEATGGMVDGVFVVFDRQQGGKEALKKRDIELWSLCDMGLLLKVLQREELLPELQIAQVQRYLRYPDNWRRANGGSKCNM